MFKAAFFIGLRYTRAKRRNHFISFISLASMLGIALGITVLITVLSVMNGFDIEIKNRVFSMVAPITVSSVNGNIDNWQSLQKSLQGMPAITHTAPFILGEVLLNHASQTQPVMMSGILPEQEKDMTELSNIMVQGKLENLRPKKFGIIIGEYLSMLLGANVGDKLTVVTPQVSLTPAGVIPRFKRFTVVGVFRAGNGFGFDKGLSFIHLRDAQALFGLGNHVTGLHVSIKDVFLAPLVGNDISKYLTPTANITTWIDQFGDFFRAVQLEKTMMFFILLLIIAVAAFNLVATLMMVVNEKAADIAILRTMGATPGMIMSIFIVQGAVIGIIGTLFGLIGGIMLASNVTTLVHWIERVFHVQFLSANIYFVNYLPSHIEWRDVMKISFAALSLSMLATIYPARRASKIDPVESLRYE
jgi:lipoprotein-releasing system permease protein